MERINKESIYDVLEQAGRRGLHITSITLLLVNRFTQLFDEAPLDKNKVKLKVRRILLYEVQKKRNGLFVRVKDPKTQKYRRGRYRVAKTANKIT
jgi:hypothetical protein